MRARIRSCFSLWGGSMPEYRLNINEKDVVLSAEPDMPLLWAIRDLAGLKGTRYSCGKGLCGSCTVHINGRAMRSCVMPVSAVGNSRVTTIEGLSADGSHPLQKAWKKHQVPQCGYCQSGQIMSAAALLEQAPDADEATIRAGMSGNICRCGTYQRIGEAIRSVAAGEE